MDVKLQALSLLAPGPPRSPCLHLQQGLGVLSPLGSFWTQELKAPCCRSMPTGSHCAWSFGEVGNAVTGALHHSFYK